MKTIEPLFLDELREEFDKHYDNPKKLEKLYERISKIKIFDPACGSGNFLIIAYKELRKLEHAIIERLFEDQYIANQLKNKLQSRIDLDNFYGIEIDDFACEVAVLSLYLAKHQMNIEFEKQFGREIKLIPLRDKANVVHGNAAGLDWQEVCPNKPVKKALLEEKQQRLIATELDNQRAIEEEVWEEIYLIGNPPYLGSRNQKIEHKTDLKEVFVDGYKSLDYVSIWFYQGAEYIRNTKAQLAFVSTNSITQGEHVGLLWPKILVNGINIKFGYTSFLWRNSARNNAGVTCVVIGLQSGFPKKPKIYTESHIVNVEKINPYLAQGDHVYLYRRSASISGMRDMVFGNMAADGGHLILSDKEYSNLLDSNKEVIPFVRKLLGSTELINGQKRYCLWLTKADKSILNNDFVAKRVSLTAGVRRESSRPELADIPHLFAQRSASPDDFISAIVVPRVSSERREYIPIGFIANDTVPTDRLQVIPGGNLRDFSIITSRMHMAWVNRTCGRLKTDYNYSIDIVYNNFPLPKIINAQMVVLDLSAKEILLARENHTEKTLAEMYDPDKMPDNLREAHHRNDLLVDSLYRQKPYANDEERLADLFKLYEEMTAKEKK